MYALYFTYRLCGKAMDVHQDHPAAGDTRQVSHYPPSYIGVHNVKVTLQEIKKVFQCGRCIDIAISPQDKDTRPRRA